MEPDDVDRSHLGEGHYANYAEIAHNVREFVFDFGQVWLKSKPAGIYVRVITTPDTAKYIYELLNQELAKYRNQFGDIPGDSDSDERQL